MGKTFKDNPDRYEIKNNRSNQSFFKKNNFKSIRFFGCLTGKVGFKSEFDAKTRANEILTSSGNRGVTNFRVYQCEFCKNYHLTSKV